MNRPHQNPTQRILAIDIISRGLGFAALERSTALIDSGVMHLPHQLDSVVSRKFNRKVDLIKPDVLVLEDVAQNTRRRSRAIKLTAHLIALAKERGMSVCLLSTRAIRTLLCLPGDALKRDVVRHVADRIPELADSLPRVRTLWMSEDSRMATFDAAALALAYLAKRPKCTGRVH